MAPEIATDSLREAFRRGMRGLAGGVCVIATEYEGLRYGLTVTSVCSLSLRPPSLVICVNRDAEAHDPICRTRALSVNVLSASQQSTARVFGGLETERGPLRFAEADWTRSAAGLPALIGCLSNLDCHVEEIADGRTHSILICAVRAVSVDGGAPLVYWERDFHTLADARPVAAHAPGDGP